MSWDQGVQIREELPEKFISWAEKKYLETVGESGHLEYVTWFHSQPEILYLDFGNGTSFKLTIPKGLL